MSGRRRVLVLLKRTSYQKLLLDEHDERVEELLKRGDPTVRTMMQTHRDHEETAEEVRVALRDLGVDGDFVHGARTRVVGPSFALVVTVGGDGTLLAASHAVGTGTPLLGINSAPHSSVGFFCGGQKGAVHKALAAALDGSMDRTTLNRMTVERNGTVLHARVLNEALYCHASPAATSKYILHVRTNAKSGTEPTSGQVVEGQVTEQEEQRSSGMWIGPAAGSTAAQRSAGGKVLPLTSTALQYVVREPYTTVGTTLRLPKGVLEDGESLTLWNKMKDAKLYIDGHHLMYDANIGDCLVFRRSDEPLTVLGLPAARSSSYAPPLGD